METTDAHASLYGHIHHKHCPCPKAGGEHHPLGNPETLTLTSPESRYSWRRKGGFGGKKSSEEMLQITLVGDSFPL